MKISSSHQRLVTAAPGQIAALIAELDGGLAIELAPAPRALGGRRLRRGLMRWGR
jgi:hypothetical protein